MTSDTFHIVALSDRVPNMAPRIDCVPWCSGPGDHIHEYRAPDVRPTVTQTAAFKALDERKPDAEAAAD